MKNKYIFQMFIISSILGLLIIGCRLTGAVFPGLAKAVPTSTSQPVDPTQTPEVLPTILVDANSIVITFAEADVLSWITASQTSDSGYTLTDPAVTMDNGIMLITGKLTSGFISGTVEATFRADVDSSGNPEVIIQSMKVGGMEIPATIKDQYTSAINTAILSAVQNDLNGRKIASITIEGGIMTIIASK